MMPAKYSANEDTAVISGVRCGTAIENRASTTVLLCPQIAELQLPFRFMTTSKVVIRLTHSTHLHFRLAGRPELKSLTRVDDGMLLLDFAFCDDV